MQSAEGKVLRAQELAEESRSKSEDDIARLKKEYQIMSEERRENERIDDEKMRKADEIQRQACVRISSICFLGFNYFIVRLNVFCR